MDTSKALGIGVAGVAALGLGVAGATMSSAQDSTTPSASSSTASSTDQAKGDRKPPADDGRTLTADAASKAIAAAQAKEPDAKVKGVHLDRGGKGYEVQMVRTDGTMIEVVLDSSLTVTSVDTRGPGGHDGRGGPGGHGRGPGADSDGPGGDGDDGHGPSDDQQPKSGGSSSSSTSPSTTS